METNGDMFFVSWGRGTGREEREAGCFQSCPDLGDVENLAVLFVTVDLSIN